MSETPRVDAAEHRVHYIGDEGECDYMAVVSDFARQLERELSTGQTAALEQAARLCEERAAVIALGYSESDQMPLYAFGAHNEAVCLAIAIRALAGGTTK